MYDDEDYLLVYGDFTRTRERVTGSESTLTAGTIEIKGDFYQKGGTPEGYNGHTSNSVFNASGTHRTVFSGNSTQCVSFQEYSYGKNKFENLVLKNNSQEGVVFLSPVIVSKLFDHNSCVFILYNNGRGSSFVDYDGDGMLDHVDPYPTDPNNMPTVEKKCGDSDGDGEVTIIDATCIQRYLAQFELTTFDEVTADADGDGEITIVDATIIQRYLAQFENIFHIGEAIE